MVSQAIAAKDPEHCAAIHLNYLFTPPPSPEALSNMTPREADGWQRFNHYMQEDSGYSQQQATRPETLGYGLTDSPGSPRSSVSGPTATASSRTPSPVGTSPPTSPSIG
jgi:hypothetical protein